MGTRIQSINCPLRTWRGRETRAARWGRDHLAKLFTTISAAFQQLKRNSFNQQHVGVSASDDGLKMSSFQSQELVNSMGRIIPCGSPLSLVNSVCFQNGLLLFHPSLPLPNRADLTKQNKQKNPGPQSKYNTRPMQDHESHEVIQTP